MSKGRPITMTEASRITLGAIETTDQLMREDREREIMTPDPSDPPDVPTAPAAFTSADAASFLAGQVILMGAAPPQVYAGMVRELMQLRARVAELEAERDEYARVALIGLSGIVCTPEKGYLRDGGPGQLAADFRELRKRVAELEARERVLHGRIANLTARLSACLDCLPAGITGGPIP